MTDVTASGQWRRRGVLALALASSGVWAASYFTRQKPRFAPVTDSGPILPEARMLLRGARKLTVKRHGEQLTFVRQTTGWHLQEAADFPVLDARIASVIEALANVRAHAVLHDPGTKISALFASDAVAQFTFWPGGRSGQDSPEPLVALDIVIDAGRAFLRRSGAPPVYQLVNPPPLPHSLRDWLDFSFAETPIDALRVATIELIGGGSYRLERRSPGSALQLAGRIAPANPDRLTEVTKAFARLEPTRLVTAPGPSGPVLAKRRHDLFTGLSQEWRISQSGPELFATLTISAARPDLAAMAARINLQSAPWCWVFDAAARRDLAPSLTELQSKLPPR